jgi:hypothetical protein
MTTAHPTTTAAHPATAAAHPATATAHPATTTAHPAHQDNRNMAIGESARWDSKLAGKGRAGRKGARCRKNR